MKSIKLLGLAATVAVSLTAFPSVASASPGFFAAESYSATVTGKAVEKEGELTLKIPTKCVSPALSGTLAKPSETLTSSTSEFCGSTKMNGCEFIFHPPVEGTNGTFDIGGSKCTGITVVQKSYEEKILPQTGLAATFENAGSGASATVKTHAQATGVKYEVIGEGTFSNGTYTTTWSLSGEHSGSSTGVSVVPYPGFSVIGGGAQYAEFHSDLYPVTIGGKQASGIIGGKELKKIELSTASGTLKCNVATFGPPVGMPESIFFDESVLYMSPTVGECNIGSLLATVTPKAECRYRFEPTDGTPYVGSLYMCETEITFPERANCKITVLGQIHSGVEYVNTGSGSSKAVEAKANLTGLEYQVSSGKNCPNEPADGSHSDGKYKGVIKLNVAKVG